MNRNETLRDLAAAPLDLLVVGGGIVGAGVVRDAAMRGLRAGLVERHDFAFGTSSRSSRLLHGGLRYLEQGRVRLVREASLEKMRLHQLAPHLAQPLGFVFPSYRPSGRPLWQLRIGVKLYDLLCGGRNLRPSFGLARDRALALLPELNPDGLRGAVCYYDGLTNDARLVLDTLRSAARHGARLANYAPLRNTGRRDGLWHAEVEDLAGGATLRLQARTIVNATGPWSEHIPHSGVKLRLSKGIHVVLPAGRLTLPHAVVITEGKRILFVLPWGERVIVGTTDTDYHGAPEDVKTEPEDIAYVLRVLNGFFPGGRFTSADIISSWAGIRPLVANPDDTPSDVSREHQILSPEPGWWDITGGKLTTYRLMAEQAVDRIARELGVTTAPCRTGEEPLCPPEGARFSGVLPPAFGREAVEHFVREEWARSLEDVMVRRSSWHYYWPDAADRARQVAAWMAPLAGWTPERTADELEHYLRLPRVAA